MAAATTVQCYTYAWGAFSRCVGVAQPPPSTNFDALAVAIGVASAVIMTVTLVVVVLSLVLAVRWSAIVRSESKSEAQGAAKEEIGKVAPKIADEWLSDKGVALVVAALQLRGLVLPGKSEVSDPANQIADVIDENGPAE